MKIATDKSKCILFSATAFIVGILAYYLEYPLLLGIVLMIVNIVTIFGSRRNWLFLIINICIGYSNYSIFFANYINRVNIFYTEWYYRDVSFFGLLLLLAMSVIMCCSMPDKRKCTITHRALIKDNESNMLVFVMICMILALIFILTVVRTSSVGGRAADSSIFEYALIFFIIGFYYCGRKKYRIGVLSVFLFAYVIQDFTTGGRITGLQLIICWMLCVFVEQIKVRQAIIVGCLGIVLLSILGDLRQGFNFSAFDAWRVVDRLVSEGCAMDTAYSAYYTSLTFLEMKEMLPYVERLYLLKQYILSLFFGGGVADSNLANIAAEYYLHFGGGMLPMYIFFYLGWVGIGLLGVLMNKWCSMIAEPWDEASGLKKCLSIYIVSSTFRWYLYSPSNLLRGSIIFSMVYFLCMCISNTTRTRRISGIK